MHLISTFHLPCSGHISTKSLVLCLDFGTDTTLLRIPPRLRQSSRGTQVLLPHHKSHRSKARSCKPHAHCFGSHCKTWFRERTCCMTPTVRPTLRVFRPRSMHRKFAQSHHPNKPLHNNQSLWCFWSNPEHGEGDGDLWCINPLKRIDGSDVSPHLVLDKGGRVVPPRRDQGRGQHDRQDVDRRA